MPLNQQVAIKVISKAKIRQSKIPIEKEVLLHKNLQHPNVVKLLEVLEDVEYYYLIQALCAGGELFERIEPDKGFPLDAAHFYFRQLLAAVLYLHDRGIAHRDIKPENLLLDERGNLKLADFGLSTLFRKGRVRRRLHTVCGSALYMAPEVVSGDYDGDSADLWSCGVVLFVMLVGCHPCEDPLSSGAESPVLRPGGLHAGWGERLPVVCRDLVLGLLSIDAKKRWTAERILSHSWFTRDNPLLRSDGQCKDPYALMSLLSPLKLGDDSMSISAFAALSQPQPRSSLHSQLPGSMMHKRSFPGFSQPEHYSEMPSESAASREDLFAEKITRLLTNLSLEDTLKELGDILDDFLIDWKRSPIRNQIHFTTVDKRKNPLLGEILVVAVAGSASFVIFTKGKGDPLEFKRLFKLIQGKLF